MIEGMADSTAPRRHRDRHPSSQTDRLSGVDAWAPIVLDDERHYRQQLAEEIRPLVEACRRLRDRGLLD
jgi:hypothetical protein